MPFWTMTNADRLMVVAGKGKEATSVPFLFKKPDNVILQFGNKNEVHTHCMYSELVPLCDSVHMLSGAVVYWDCMQ